MTDEQIEKLATEVRADVLSLLGFPRHLAGEGSVDIEEHEAEAIATEVERAVVKTCFLIEFKRQRQRQREREG